MRLRSLPALLAVLVASVACEPVEGVDAVRATSAPTQAPAVPPPAAKPAAPAPKPAAAKPAVELPPGDDGAVTRHVDGDTIVVGRTKIRLIGIDTPEVSGGTECFGREASAAIAALLPLGERVRLVYDVDRHDRYGRTLAYVFRSRDGAHVNLRLAQGGFAAPLTVPPNVAHADTFAAAARQARAAGRGLWSACDEPEPVRAVPPPPAQPQRAVPQRAVPAPPAAAPAGDCHPSYPEVCIPPAPPDLDCPQLEHRRFTVVGVDPHGFDGDRDGIGCESG